MNDLISVLIADDNLDFSTLLKEYLNNTDDMTVAGVAQNGIEAVDMIRNLKPDVVVLDIIMPNLDGIGVLEKISEISASEKPIIIVLTAIGKDAVVRKAVELGADYYIMKPFDMDVLATHIRELYKMHNSAEEWIKSARKGNDGPTNGYGGKGLDQIVTGLINSIGITPNLAGYHLLREAVVLSVEDPAVLNSISKLVYPVLAKRNNTTARNVDRAIRCAISSACNKSKSGRGYSEISSMLSNNHRNPGNLAVIRFLAEKARQMMQLDYAE
jgi:two-component system response regulator (stage 0 sporulation protein A)